MALEVDFWPLHKYRYHCVHAPIHTCASVYYKTCTHIYINEQIAFCSAVIEPKAIPVVKHTLSLAIGYILLHAF